jgi:hypothetical protein
MKKRLMSFGILCIVFTSALANAGVGIDFDIHLGNRSEPSPPPVVPEPPPIIVETPPEMVYVGDLGIYVAVGIPNDLFFQDNIYYYNVSGVWYQSASYRGPWVRTVDRGIPPGLRRHRIEEIHRIREHAREDYREHGDRFRGRHFRAEDRHDMGKGHGRKEGHYKMKHHGHDDDE